ncbi:MAG: DUF4760 domain-containing protein [Pseudomonadota bacterium]
MLETQNLIQIAILLAILAQGLVALHGFRRQRVIENAHATLTGLHTIAKDLNETSEAAYAHFTEGGFDFATSSVEQKNTLMRFLDTLEEIAVAVNLDIYDIRIVNRVMGWQIIRAAEDFDYFVIKIRERQNSQSLYKEFRLLAEKIKLLRELEPIEYSIWNERSSFRRKFEASVSRKLGSRQ